MQMVIILRKNHVVPVCSRPKMLERAHHSWRSFCLLLIMFRYHLQLHRYPIHRTESKIHQIKTPYNMHIEDVVKRSHNKTVEFTKLAEAKEYRKTLQLYEQPQKVAQPV